MGSLKKVRKLLAMRFDILKVSPRLGSAITVFGCLQFLIFSTVAMFFYGGGLAWDPTTNGYMFWHNFFSDLGRTVSYSGIPNAISEPLFNVSLIVYAVSLIFFYISFPLLLSDRKYFRRVILLGGILSVMGLIRVGLNPDDIRPDEHMLGIWLWGIPLFVVVVLVILDTIQTRNLSKGILFYTGGFAILLAIHIYQGVIDVSGPAIQKIVVYTNIGWFMLMSRRLWEISPST